MPNPDFTKRRWLTPRQVMEELQIGEATAYREIQFGALRPYAMRIGRQWRVDAAGLDQLCGGSE